MPPRRHARSVSRRSTPLSPPKPSPPPALRDARLQNKRTSRSTSREVFTDAQNDLQNIDQVLETVNEEAAQQSDSFDRLPSPSARSESVSTLQNDLEELDHDVLVLSLNDLHNESLALLSSFEISDEDRLNSAIQQMSRTGSLQQKKLNLRAKKLSNIREPFGIGDFINPVLIVRKLAGIVDLHQINYGRWRPDAILYLANLAQQMVAILSSSPDDRGALLEYLYNNFPRAFVGDSNFSFATGLVEDTRNLAIEMMTQFFTHTIEFGDTEQSENPERLAERIFEDDETVSRDFQDIDSLEALSSRLELLKGHCTVHNDRRELLNELKESYPLSAFILQTAKWSISRMRELKVTIDKQGGIENIVDLLTSGNYEADVREKTITDPGDNFQADVPDEAGSNTKRWMPLNDSTVQGRSKRSSAPLNPRIFSAEIRQFREEQAKHALEVSGLRVQPSSTTAAHEAREIQQTPTPVDDDDYYRPLQDDDDGQVEFNHRSLPSRNREGADDDDDDDDDELPPSTQQTREVMETLERQAIEREKENRPAPTKRSFLDRQPDARQVKWQDPSVRDSERTSRQPTKRLLAEIDNEEEEEDDFEQDKRPTKVSRTAKGKQPVSQIYDVDDDDDNNSHRSPLRERTLAFTKSGRPAASRSVITTSSQPVRGSRQMQSALNSSNRLPPSTAPARSRAPSPPRARMADFQAEARARTAESKEYYGRRQNIQVRVPWNDLESDRLVEMVARQGTKWARILHEDANHDDGPLLQSRSQVALKDKARNMKVLYLKTRKLLPPGFEFVSIGQRMINELRDLGIDYVEGRFEGQDLELELDND